MNFSRVNCKKIDLVRLFYPDNVETYMESHPAIARSDHGRARLYSGVKTTFSSRGFLDSINQLDADSHNIR